MCVCVHVCVQVCVCVCVCVQVCVCVCVCVYVCVCVQVCVCVVCVCVCVQVCVCVCVCVCVVCMCVCLRKEEGVGNGVCPLSHRLEAKCSTKCIIMVCNHWSHPMSINFDYPISWYYLLIK